MKNAKIGWVFVSGVLLGVAATLCVGASGKDTPSKITNETGPKKDLSHVQVVSYPNGGTGFFDPETATIYVYSSDLKNCYMTRQITSLGEPLIEP